jgi:hypothetical protein
MSTLLESELMQNDSPWDPIIISEVLKTAIASPVNMDAIFVVRY